MKTKHWSFKETNLTIQIDHEEAINALEKKVMDHRKMLEEYILMHPDFQTTLEPIEVEEDAPCIVRVMAEAARKAGVGPMAAVAGTIANVAAKAAIDAGAKNAIVDNGGDIAIYGKRPFKIGIYAGDSPLSNQIGFQLQTDDLPLGICTSSGTVGHSISFGDADAVTVVARSPALADAAATAIGNLVKGSDLKKAIENGLSAASKILDIRGVLIIIGENMGAVGDLPQIIHITKPEITTGGK